VCLSVLVFFLW